MDDFRSHFSCQKREITKLIKERKRQKAFEKAAKLEGELHQEIIANPAHIPIKVFKGYLKKIKKIQDALLQSCSILRRD